MNSKTILFAITAAAALVVAGPVLAHGGGGMGGGSMMGSSGMMVVADDGSLLVTNMDMSGTMGGGGSDSSVSRALINVSPDGTERWRVSFSEGWPMMPVTDGDLVVVVLVDDWFMGSGGMGDGDFGGGMGGGMMGTSFKDAGAQVTVVGLDLSSGAERWRISVDGDMGSMAQFSPDGSRIYLSIMEMGTMGNMGSGPMQQDQAAGSGLMGSVSIVALDRNGTQLWTYSVDDSGNGGMMRPAVGALQ